MYVCLYIFMFVYISVCIYLCVYILLLSYLTGDVIEGQVMQISQSHMVTKYQGLTPEPALNC